MSIDNSKPGALPAVAPEQVAQALELRAAGANWEVVGRAIGLSANRIRYAADPVWAQMRRDRTNECKRRENAILAGHPAHFAERRPPDVDVATVLATIPPDTRTRQQRMMGDPIFERSALARRGGSSC